MTVGQWDSVTVGQCDSGTVNCYANVHICRTVTADFFRREEARRILLLKLIRRDDFEDSSVNGLEDM